MSKEYRKFFMRINRTYFLKERMSLEALKISLQKTKGKLITMTSLKRLFKKFHVNIYP